MMDDLELPEEYRLRLRHLGEEAILVARLKGRLEAGEYLARNQRVLVADLMDAGIIDHAMALEITTAIDMMHAAFNQGQQ